MIVEFQVNLQEGFLLRETPDGVKSIIGVFSEYSKVCVLTEHIDKKLLPKKYKNYEQIYGIADGFALVGWTDRGYKSIAVIKELHNDRKKSK